MEYRTLKTSEKQWLVHQIAMYLKDAANPASPTHVWSSHLIKGALLWYWTADGLDESGVAKRDAIKRRPNMLPRTQEADAQIRRGDLDGLRHEHAVPRQALFLRLLDLADAPEAQLLELLEGYCFAVVVTKDEDARLSAVFKQNMPTSRWWHGDPLARYRALELKVLDPPDRG